MLIWPRPSIYRQQVCHETYLTNHTPPISHHWLLMPPGAGTWTHACMHAHRHTHTHACTNTCIHTHTHAHTHTYTHTYTHIRTCIHTHTHTTHTQIHICISTFTEKETRRMLACGHCVPDLKIAQSINYWHKEVT